MPELVEEIARPEGIEVPETRSFTATFLETPEVRETDDGAIEFIGYAATFDRRSVDLGGFTEIIMRGAFRGVLNARDLDVVLNFNHNSNFVLARASASSQTLELREDPRGLRVYARMAPTSYAKDLKLLIERGVINAMSFAFSAAEDRWEKDEEGNITRFIRSFGGLSDVSIVVHPAYPTSTITSVRDELLAVAEALPLPEEVREDEPAPEETADAPVDDVEETRSGQAELGLARARLALKRRSL